MLFFVRFPLIFLILPLPTIVRFQNKFIKNLGFYSKTLAKFSIFGYNRVLFTQFIIDIVDFNGFNVNFILLFSLGIFFALFLRSITNYSLNLLVFLWRSLLLHDFSTIRLRLIIFIRWMEVLVHLWQCRWNLFFYFLLGSFIIFMCFLSSTIFTIFLLTTTSLQPSYFIVK